MSRFPFALAEANWVSAFLSALCLQTLGSSGAFLLSLRSTGTWLALRRHTLNNHSTVTHAVPKALWLLAYKA